MFEIKSRHLFSVMSLITIISIALANIIPAGAFSLNSIGIATTDPSLQQNAAINSPATPYVKGVVLIGLKAGISLDSSSSLSGEPDLSTSSSTLSSTLTSLEVRSVENVFAIPQNAIAPSTENSLKADSQVDLATIYRLKLDPAADVLAAIQSLSSDPAVLFAEPDYIAMKADAPTSKSTLAPSLAIVNDPLYSQQWGLAKINIEAAWAETQGSSAVILAIIDSGIDLTHPDLAAHLWVNPGEIAGNGLDDDNNGYVDDVNGWNFVEGNNDVSDDNGHGTLVAGVAAAIAGNGLGIAGTCPECTILPVKVMQVSGSANYSDIAAGILYAAQKGARVINLSLGGYADSNTLRNAIEAAANSYNAVVVAGSGNDNSTNLFYPAAYQDVLAVAGTASDDTKVNTSNYGAWVDVSAPGIDIITTASGGDWATNSGTSIAASFASGLAGLLKTLHPDWSQATIRSQIAHTTDSIESLNPAYAGLLGSGRLNAGEAGTVAPRSILSVTTTAINGDPLGRPEAGAAATLKVTLGNEWMDASGVQGTLTTSDAYVTITNGSVSFGDILSGGTGISSPVFGFDIAPGAGYNHAISFTLQLSANGGAYDVDLPMTITTRSSNQNASGTILTDTTWTNDKTYIVTNNVGVAPGKTLTIQPGTVIKFNGNYNLNVGGTLIADGTESQPIRFLSNTASAWGRIYFDNSSTDATADESGTYLAGNILRYVQVESAANGIGCNNATPYLSHVTTNGGGVNCTAGSTPAWLVDSDLTGIVTIHGIPITAWTRRASMPTARSWLGVTASNGKIYAIGGYRNGDFLKTVEAYDPATDTWVTRASMSFLRFNLGFAAANNGKIYAIGGRDYITYSSAVEEYDPVTDTWTYRASMPTERDFLGIAAASNGKIYAIGGENGDTTVEEYDPETDTWTTRASMPTGRFGLGVAAASNGKIYAIGGRNTIANLNTVEEYDPATDTWATRASMPTARYNLGVAAASNGKIYAIGGVGGETTVEEYDPATDRWTTKPGMPTGRSGLGVAAASNGKIYAIGGNGLATVEEFITDTTANGSINVQNTTIRNGNLDLSEDSQVLNSTVGGSITIGGSIPGYNNMVKNTTASRITINVNATVESNILIDGGIPGGISIESGQVLSNTIYGGGISASGDSTISHNDIENSPDWGIQSSGTGTISQNRLVGNANGIQTSGGTVQGNLIATNSGTGLEINGNTTVSNNTFTAIGGSAIKVLSGTAMTITGNNFEFNTGTFDIEDLMPGTTLASLPASGNWWGTTNTDTIDGRIFDINDDYNIGTVQYTPLASAPDQTAPAYVRNVTVLPGDVLGIETGTFQVQFSRPMDANGTPQMSFYRSAGLTWATRASMPTAREGLVVVAANNGRIYAIGGYSVGSGLLATVEEYNPVTDTWVTRASMPTAREYLGVAAASNGKIYAIGGDDNHNFTFATVEEYNPATDTWVTRASMPTAREYLGVAAASNGKIYAIGGANGSGSLATVEEYDPATDTWTTRTSMPTARGRIGVATGSNGRIYAIASGTAVEEYDPTTDTWTTRASLKSETGYERYGLAVTAASNGRIYAVGGISENIDTPGDFYMNGVDEYDPETDTWVRRRGMTGRAWLGVTEASNGKIYAIGGTLGGFGGPETNQVATVEEGTLPFETADFYAPQWSSGTQFRASYDVTALVPKDTYRVSVNDAFDTDGMRIAPNSTTTFNVDYAGFISDKTPPTKPVVTAGGNGSLTTISANWSSSDLESPITQYRYAIGTTPGGREVVDWTYTNGTSVNRNNLNLTFGSTYYVSAGARNEGGLWSESGVSNGVVAGVATTQTISGNAGVAGVTLSYTDGTLKTATSAADGSYSFSVSINWSGTVTPSKAGYSFSPVNRPYTDVVENQTGQNYIATAITYTISGNAGMGGATMSYNDGSAKTATSAADGSYSFSVSYNWSGTVTPSKEGYTFSPDNRSYNNVLENLTGNDYTATAIIYRIYLPLVIR